LIAAGHKEVCGLELRQRPAHGLPEETGASCDDDSFTREEAHP